MMSWICASGGHVHEGDGERGEGRGLLYMKDSYVAGQPSFERV